MCWLLYYRYSNHRQPAGGVQLNSSSRTIKKLAKKKSMEEPFSIKAADLWNGIPNFLKNLQNYPIKHVQEAASA